MSMRMALALSTTAFAALLAATLGTCTLAPSAQYPVTLAAAKCPAVRHDHGNLVVYRKHARAVLP